MKKQIRLGLVMVLASLLLMVLAACSGADEGSGEQQKEASPEELSGNVQTAGSSTVYPVMLALAEWYWEEQPKVNVTVDSIGSGGGFEKAVRGEIDFSNASRPIKDTEKEAAAANGIHLEPLMIAYDGLTVVVSHENDFIHELSLEQLREIFIAGQDNAKWSDIDPSWPDEPIEVFSPGHDSGTFDYFNEVVLLDAPMREDEHTTLSEDDNILVRGVANSKYAIGYFGFAYYLQNKNQLRAININGVEPSLATIQSGEYSPLSRPLFVYLNAQSLKKPQVYDFTMFLLDNAGKAAEIVGYVPLTKEEYEAQKPIVDGLRK